MTRTALVVSIAAFAVSGCTVDMQRRSETQYLEHDLICSIDTSVADERERLLPNGFLTKPYSPDLWQTYWRERVTTLVNQSFSRYRQWGYTGPSGRTLVLYLLEQRQEEGLPEVRGGSDHEKAILGQLYYELDHKRQSSCEILDRRSPVCLHSPAQRRGSLRFERPCRVAPNKSSKPTG